LLVAALALVVGLLTAATAAASVSPPSFNATLAPGGSTSVTKTVTTPPIAPNPDIAFLADSTGSMIGAIANVKANASSVLGTIKAAQPTAQFSVSEYRDWGDAFVHRINTGLTSSQSAAQAGINQWNAGGGGDWYEANLYALRRLANGAAGWRGGSTRIIAWFGDAPGHDPSGGATLGNTISALQAAGVKVIAVDVGGLNGTGQASAIVTATGGSLQSSAGGVSAAILAGLHNLPVTITPVAVGCSPLSVTFSPSSATVTSGNSATFTETITVPNNNALQGQTINCYVDFQTGFGTQSISVTIPDTTPPVLHLPPDAFNEATGPSGAIHTYTATATDNADPSPTVSCTPPSGSMFPIGTTTINCTATDASGNSTSGSFTKTVGDTIPPVLTLPPDAMNEATSPAGAVHTFTATATDTGDPSPVVVCTPPSGSTFPLGVTTITCTATDFSGNSTTGTFTKTVVDTTPPVLTMPPDATNEATGPDGAVHTFAATATDIVDTAPVVVCDPLSGTTFPLGDTVITCTATDFSGNSSSGTFTKTVVDTTPPVLTMPPDAVNEATGPDGAAHGFEVTAVDIVDPDPLIDCDAASGDVFPLGDTVITCTATDDYGNVSTGSFTKTVVDTTPPDVGCLETVNPGGKNVPKAGQKSKGQNEDGFYQVSAYDIVDLDALKLWINGLGPFAPGDRVKITEAPGATPNVKPGTGAIDWKVKVDSDAIVTSTDVAGNTGTAACLVPPPPK